MSFLVVLGNGYTLWADLTNTAAQMRGIIKEEPTAGIFTNYIRAYITNCTYEDFRPNTREDENCLIVTNLLGMLPGEKPDVIVVDCWYGGLKGPPDSWIMQYIENEFGYSTVIDNAYVRFYRK